MIENPSHPTNDSDVTPYNIININHVVYFLSTHVTTTVLYKDCVCSQRENEG